MVLVAMACRTCLFAVAGQSRAQQEDNRQPLRDVYSLVHMKNVGYDSNVLWVSGVRFNRCTAPILLYDAI